MKEGKHILATIPVGDASIFRGIVEDMEKKGKSSAAFELFHNLIKLADTCEVEVAFNQESFESVIVYTKSEPTDNQINSIPLMDSTIRGVLNVALTTLDYLRYEKKGEDRNMNLKALRVVFGETGLIKKVKHLYNDETPLTLTTFDAVDFNKETNSIKKNGKMFALLHIGDGIEISNYDNDWTYKGEVYPASLDLYSSLHKHVYNASGLEGNDVDVTIRMKNFETRQVFFSNEDLEKLGLLCGVYQDMILKSHHNVVTRDLGLDVSVYVNEVGRVVDICYSPSEFDWFTKGQNIAKVNESEISIIHARDTVDNVLMSVMCGNVYPNEDKLGRYSKVLLSREITTAAIKVNEYAKLESLEIIDNTLIISGDLLAKLIDRGIRKTEISVMLNNSESPFYFDVELPVPVRVLEDDKIAFNTHPKTIKLTLDKLKSIIFSYGATISFASSVLEINNIIDVESNEFTGHIPFSIETEDSFIEKTINDITYRYHFVNDHNFIPVQDRALNVCCQLGRLMKLKSSWEKHISINHSNGCYQWLAM